MILTGCGKSGDGSGADKIEKGIVYNGKALEIKYAYYDESPSDTFGVTTLSFSSFISDEAVDDEDFKEGDFMFRLDLSDNLFDKEIDLTKPFTTERYANWDYEVDFECLENGAMVRLRAASYFYPGDDTPISRHNDLKSGKLKATRSGARFDVAIAAETKAGKTFTLNYSGAPVKKEEDAGR